MSATTRERLQPGYFDEALKNNLQHALSRLALVSRGVMLCHSDAPGWRVVEIGEPRASAPNLTQSLVENAPLSLRDGSLELTGTVEGDGVFWQWESIPGCSVYGWGVATEDWEELRRALSLIRPDLARLLAGVP